MYVPQVSISKLIEAVKTLSLNEDDVLMISICETANIDLEAMVVALNQEGISFFGGVFPGVIGGGQQQIGGAVIMPLQAYIKPLVFEGITGRSFVLPDYIIDIPQEEKGDAIVFVDGLSSNISSFLSSIFNALGNTVKYIGGGAGSLSLKQQPCLFTNEGVKMDAAVVLLLQKKISTGVKHGWDSISGPFVATKTHKNSIIEINWQNAFEVYKDVVEADSGKTIDADNFFSISKAYPFGIQREGSEYIVRDPIAVNPDGSLQCVGEVSENVVIDILKGDPINLINAGQEAAQEAASKKDFGQALVVDCISRNLFLETAYPESLELICRKINEQNHVVNVEGILTLGEISTYGKGSLEFLNKTIVVGLI